MQKMRKQEQGTRNREQFVRGLFHVPSSLFLATREAFKVSDARSHGGPAARDRAVAVGAGVGRVAAMRLALPGLLLT